MDDLYIDLETFGTTPIKSHGVHRYAEDAQVMLGSMAWGDKPATVTDYTDPATRRGLLSALQRLIDRADKVITHGDFDRIVLASEGVTIPIEKHEDTMVLARMHSLPGGLAELGAVLGLPVDEAKNKDGARLISLFCSPTPKNWNLRRATKASHPEDWDRFVEYARQDVVAMRAIRKRLPRWNCTPLERQYWLHDQACNALGMAVDLDHAEAAIDAYEQVKADAKVEVAKLTNNGLASVGQRGKLLDLLKAEYDWTEADLTKGTLERVLRGEVMPELRALLLLRLKASAASPAKYKALLKATCKDGRLRDTLVYCGAGRTGRDSGRVFQPQNLPRPSLKRPAIEQGIEALKAGCADLLYDIPELVVSAVRGTIIAKPGHKLLVADLSNIEGRVLAWLAGEEWKLEAFRANDRGEGEEIYILTAAGILGKPTSEVTKDERDKYGKVPELAGGFQGWLGAYRRMGGVKIEALSDSEIEGIAGGWRDRHPMIRKLWYAMEDAARAAIGNPTKGVRCGKIGFDVAEGPDGMAYLRMKLPGGRYLSYREPTGGLVACEVCGGKGVLRAAPDQPYETCGGCKGEAYSGSESLGYMGVSQNTHQWGKQGTYGGKLTENGTQATARDIFFHGYHLARQRGYDIVLRVHDELVAEVPIDGDLTLDGLIGCMVTNPVWAPDLPLAAKGFETTRYFKD